MEVLIVGAGLSGATIARKFAENGDKVTVIDKRQTIGGNVYDCVDENNIIVQPYGPHIFHTSEKEVFEFLSNFTEWELYEHRVKANVNGTLVPVPFNMTALFKLYPADQAERIKNILIAEVGEGKKVPVLTLKQHANEEVRAFGEFVYQNIFYIYTKKQWGFKPEELGEAVMNRVPVYISEEDRYFTDTYQYMPIGGFTPMVEKMLAHQNITVKLGVDAADVIKLDDGVIYYEGNKFGGAVIYTGCLDELFGYKFGVLPYRSLQFDFETLDTPSFQDAAVVNYTTSEDYTRISEFSKFTCKPQEKTVIVKEYSKDFQVGMIPYYPIPLAKNHEHYGLYAEEAKKYGNLYLLGRLAAYKYINMDIAVKNAIEMFNQIKSK